MDIYREELIRNLVELSAKYRWTQFGSGKVANQPSPIPAAFDDTFCKPCATSKNCVAKEGCSCCATEDVRALEDCDISPLVLPPSAKAGRSTNKRVIIDSDEDDEHMVPPPPPIAATGFTNSADSSPIFVQRAPGSARSKTSRRVISDSESEEDALHAQRVQSKPSSPQYLQDGRLDKITSQLDDLSLGDSSSVSSEDSDNESENDQDNDWIVNDSDSQEGSEEGSKSDDMQNSDGFSEQSDENIRPGKKNACIDLTQSPDATLAKKQSNPTKPKNPISKKTVGILSTTNITNTPARGKSKNAQFTPCTVTPSRKLSRKEMNQQRVEALSTGKKNFKTASVDLAVQLYALYNEVIFENQLPEDLSVTWNKRMLTTAGYCKCHKKQIDGVVHRTASIELSTKVCT